MVALKNKYVRLFDAVITRPTRTIFSLQKSASRWGSFSSLVSFAQFFLSLAISVLGISIVRGRIAMPTWIWVAFWVVFFIGVVGGLVALGMAVYFLSTQNNTLEAKADRRRDCRIKRTVILSEKIYKKLNEDGKQTDSDSDITNTSIIKHENNKGEK
jgi:hypothetical protein